MRTKDTFDGATKQPAKPAPEPAPKAAAQLKDAAAKAAEGLSNAARKAAELGQAIQQKAAEVTQAVQQTVAPLTQPIKEKVGEAARDVERMAAEAIDEVRRRVPPKVSDAVRSLEEKASALPAPRGESADKRRARIIEEGKKLEARLAPFARRVEKSLDKSKLDRAVRKWRPLIQRIDELCSVLKRRKNADHLLDLLKKVVPRKGQARPPVVGAEALTLVEAFFERMSIDLPSLQKAAARAGLKTTFLLGLSGDAAVQFGVDGSVGLAYTFRSETLRWYWQRGKTLGFANVGAGASVQAGLVSGGAENQEGRFAEFQLKAEAGEEGTVGVTLDAKSHIPTGFMVGYGVGASAFILTANVIVGEARTGPIACWSDWDAKKELAKALSRMEPVVA